MFAQKWHKVLCSSSCKRWQGDKRQRRIYSSAFWAKLPSRKTPQENSPVAKLPSQRHLFFSWLKLCLDQILYEIVFLQLFSQLNSRRLWILNEMSKFFLNISITFKTTPDANQSPGNPFWCLVDLVPIKNERHEVKDNMSKNKLRNMSMIRQW